MNKRAILAALASFILGGSLVAECSNGAKIRWDAPEKVEVRDSTTGS